MVYVEMACYKIESLNMINNINDIEMSLKKSVRQAGKKRKNCRKNWTKQARSSLATSGKAWQSLTKMVKMRLFPKLIRIMR